MVFLYVTQHNYQKKLHDSVSADSLSGKLVSCL